tara:strand:- start:217 stop:861 length:645 start_codon:yes stop_codon:yes gene_type:complete
LELHRLKPLEEEFNKELFNKLYAEVQPLKRRLVYQINPHKLGVTPDIIESWFDDKILFTFNKYYQANPENVTKAKILSSLSNFKNRILRKGYQELTENHTISIGEDNEVENFISDEHEESARELFLNLALSFMEKHLNSEAMLVYDIIYSPPEYITSRMSNPKGNIPARLIIDFLGWEQNTSTVRYIGELKSEIAEAIESARDYFQENPNLIRE